MDPVLFQAVHGARGIVNSLFPSSPACLLCFQLVIRHTWVPASKVEKVHCVDKFCNLLS